MTQILTGETLAAALSGLPDWTSDPGETAIRRSFRFADFSAAFAFMTRVALLAETATHHPEMVETLYNRVEIALSTHSAGGVTDKDIALARAIGALV